ncbi:MAG: ribonuclease HII [Holosporales bacterium]|jgi:ribonuclease HII|nr:ribonuclease HII [Holosporales bacterium]
MTEKCHPSFEFELQMESAYKSVVAGIDEAGRGPLAGPVVAASVAILDKQTFLMKFAKINDSKLLTKKQREYFFQQLTTCDFVKFAVGIASVDEIDKINILQATFLAMNRSLELLITNTPTLHISSFVVDGNAIPTKLLPGIFIVKGDSRSYSIAAASIIAKVSRDNIMQSLAVSYPMYCWDSNMGYGTKAHFRAIQTFGITDHHRKSFVPCCENKNDKHQITY